MSAPSIASGDWSLRMTAPPAQEPVSLSQAKLALRVADDLDDDDLYISLSISAARSYLEKTYDVKVITQSWELLLQNFPRADRIRFPVGPIQTVDYFRYTDTGFNVTDIPVGNDASSGLLVRLSKVPAEIVLPFGKVWPGVTLQTADAIAIGFTAGFMLNASPNLMPIPPQIIQAIFLLTDHWYENRGAVTLGSLMKSDPIAHGVESLMASIGFSSYS